MHMPMAIQGLRHRVGRVLAGCLAAQACVSGAGEWQEPAWTVSGGVGYIGYENDGLLKGGPIASLKLARNFGRWWSAEASYSIAPFLDGNRNGSAPGIEHSWVQGGALDLAVHPWRDYNTDPYLAVGASVSLYDKKVLDDQYDFGLRAGLGIAQYLSDHWFIRVDGVMLLPGDPGGANFVVDAGLGMDFGLRPPPPRRIGGADRYQGPPPASRSQGSSPGPDHRTSYRPRPNPSTGPGHRMLDPNVDRAGTESAAREGVAVNPSPVARRAFDLDVQFAFNSTKIDPAYFPALDRIGRTLADDPGLIARIEGHTDQTPGANRDRNTLISQQRAQAVLNYLADVHAISRSRLTAVGCGFDRPKAPNDAKTGNPVNRRVEVRLQKRAQVQP